MTDEEKQEKCIRETGYPCTVVPQSLYDAAVAWGVDVTRFVPDKPCPVEHVITIQHKLPSSAEMRAELKRKLDAGEPLGAEHVKTEEEKAAYRSEFERIIAAGRYSTVAYDYHGTPYAPKRKSVDEQRCTFGIACLPGRNGKCTACAMDEK